MGPTLFIEGLFIPRLISHEVSDGTVDGSEILHQLIGSLSHFLQGFLHPGGCLGLLPSTVVVN